MSFWLLEAAYSSFTNTFKAHLWNHQQIIPQRMQSIIIEGSGVGTEDHVTDIFFSAYYKLL